MPRSTASLAGAGSALARRVWHCRAALDEYLRIRRRRGFQLERAEERLPEGGRSPLFEVADEVTDPMSISRVASCWRAKRGGVREIPLHESTSRALGDYDRLRDRHVPNRATTVFFV